MSHTPSRRVLVHYGPINEQLGKKIYILPALNIENRKSDLLILREKCHQHIMNNPCLKEKLGCNDSTSIEDIEINQIIEGFSQVEIEVLGPYDDLEDRAENLFVTVQEHVLKQNNDGVRTHANKNQVKLPPDLATETGLKSFRKEVDDIGNACDQEVELSTSRTLGLLNQLADSQKQSGNDEVFPDGCVSQVNSTSTSSEKSVVHMNPDLFASNGNRMLLVTVDSESVVSTEEIIIAEQHPSAVQENSAQTVTPTLPLSLPKEGDEESDLSPAMVIAIREGKLSLNLDSFIRVCAKHLVKTQPSRSKAMYAEYADLIVNAYGESNPCLMDRHGHVSKTIKAKIVKCITNRRAHEKYKEPRKVKRISKKRKATNNEADDSAAAGVNSNADKEGSVGGDDLSKFKARRAAVNALDQFSTADLFEKFPEYKDFQTVYEDFLLIMESDGVAESVFKKHYIDLASQFRNFLSVKGDASGAKKEFSPDDEGDLSLVLAINKMASNQRGVKSVPPILAMKQVGKPVDPDPNGMNPHGILFFDGPKIHSMLILGGGILHYKNIKLDSVGAALFNLIAVQFIIRLEYPATYGILDVIDRFCLRKPDVNAPLVKYPKRAKKKKEFQCITVFLSNFNKFLKDDFEKESPCMSLED